MAFSGKQNLIQRKIVELANTSTRDANGTVLGTWNPHHMIQGPKGTIFVACNTAVKASYGSNSVYCYQFVISQNTATGEYSTSNVYPVYANSNYLNNSWQYCTGLALDYNDPPNLYYATGNTIYKISPKGYSYQVGDATITQLFSENHLRTTYNYNAQYPVMGKSLIIRGTPDLNLYREPYSYVRMKVDKNNRLFFSARSNIFCYDSSNSSLELVYCPEQHVANIAYTSLLSANVETLCINSFDLDLDTNDVYFTLKTTPGNGSLCILGKVSPNANGSYNVSNGGQTSQVLMQSPVTTQAPFFTDGTQGTNNFRALSGSKVTIRRPKN